MPASPNDAPTRADRRAVCNVVRLLFCRTTSDKFSHCPDGVQVPMLSAQKRAWLVSCTVRWIEVVPPRAPTCKRSASYWAEPSGGVCNAPGSDRNWQDDLMVNGVTLPQPEFSGLPGFCAELAGALGVY